MDASDIGTSPASAATVCRRHLLRSMEPVGEEQSYSGNYSLPVPTKFLVFYYSLLTVILVPVIFLNVLIILALLLDRTTVGLIRLVLGNISVACLVVAVTLLMFNIAGIIMPFTDIGSPERVIEICRLTSLVVSAGGAARFLFLSAFSVTVYIIITRHMPSSRESKQRVFIGFVVTIILLWFLAILSGLPVLFEPIVTSSCRHTVLGGSIKVTLFGLVFGTGTFTTSITFLLLTVFYIRKYIITDPDVLFKKTVLKLGFFLLLGNVINCVGQIVPSIVGVIVNEGQPTLAIAIIAYLCLALLDLSLVPTPILIIIYFNPVRTHLKSWFCYCCHRQPKMGKRIKIGETSASSIYCCSP